MKYLFVTLFSLALYSCSKDSDGDDSGNKDRTLSVMVEDYEPPTITNNYWAIIMNFNPSVTIKGSMKVDFDIYYLSAFHKHHTERLTFSVSNGTKYLHQTMVGSGPWSAGWEIKNIKVDSLLITEGNYNITVK